ncbi:MAG: ATP-binding protein [Pseudomonadota bacterium]
MIGIPFRDIFPKGLYARSVLMTLLPVIIILTLMTIYYYNGHLRAVNLKLSQAVAREVVLIDQTCAAEPGNLSSHTFIETTLGLQFECDAEPPQGVRQDRFFYASLVRSTIEQRLRKTIDLTLNPDTDLLSIYFATSAGNRLIEIDRKRAIAINGHIFIVWVVLFSLFMVFTALAFLRNHVRSILRLTEVTQAFGRGVDLEDYRPSGAREIRAAARAVTQMRRRLVRFAEQRTKMLAGISHDLRTPLTRLKLQLAMLEQSDDVKAAKQDLNDMELMLDEYLAFVRGEEEEAARAIDVTDMLSDISSGYPEADITLQSSVPIMLLAKPISLKRALSNLVSNSVAYADKTEISVHDTPGGVTIWVDDDGPGIPREQYEEALKPFTRLEDGRSQNKPGTGLGLALANDATRQAGGRLTLHSSPLGGLRVEMKLPH